jgi:hypothetical protein
MPTRPPVGAEERLMDRAARYFVFADRFGWTTDQVDASPALVVDRMLIVAQVRDELQDEAQRAADRG